MDWRLEPSSTSRAIDRAESDFHVLYFNIDERTAIACATIASTRPSPSMVPEEISGPGATKTCMKHSATLAFLQLSAHERTRCNRSRSRRVALRTTCVSSGLSSQGRPDNALRLRIVIRVLHGLTRRHV